MCKYLCYLTISLNDQLHITPESAAINHSESAYGALSYLKLLSPQEFSGPCLHRSSHYGRAGLSGHDGVASCHQSVFILNTLAAEEEQ